MKKFISTLLALVCVFGLCGCNADRGNTPNDDVTNDNTYIVMEVTESNLLVAEIGENGKAVEAKQYSVPNWFYPSTEIEEGYKITIKHSGVVQETFPMQFAEINSMEYWDKKTGLSTVVIAD